MHAFRRVHATIIIAAHEMRRRVSDAVAYANQVLQQILNSISVTNIEELLRQAEIILQEIQARDFRDEASRANDELQQAIDRESTSRGSYVERQSISRALYVKRH